MEHWLTFSYYIFKDLFIQGCMPPLNCSPQRSVLVLNCFNILCYFLLSFIIIFKFSYAYLVSQPLWSAASQTPLSVFSRQLQITLKFSSSLLILLCNQKCLAKVIDITVHRRLVGSAEGIKLIKDSHSCDWVAHSRYVFIS